MSKNEYFAAKEPKETLQIILAKADQFKNTGFSTAYREKQLLSYAAYHGMSMSDSGNGHQITFTGEQGELVSCKVNHYRNIADHMLQLITASRPALETRAINTDAKSLAQAKLANGLLEYYLREKRLEDCFIEATKYAVVLGSGFIKMEWNGSAGEKIENQDDPSIEEYEGDVDFSVHSPNDVFQDATKEGQKKDWIVVRSFKNKFDIAAQNPDQKNEIEALPTKSDNEKIDWYFFEKEETSDVPMYEFYHNRTKSLPLGRYILGLENGIILYDGPLPYKKIPVFRISAGEILGTPYGYTPMFDLLPLQDALDMTYSTILSNQNAFGVQSLLVPSNSNVKFESLAGGLNFIECDFRNGKPEAINFTNTPKEIFDFLGLTIQQMETISGINAVIRGNPEANLRSGSSLALVQSNAIQFMSGLAQQYNQLLEDVGTGLLQTLKDNADSKRVATIVGINNRSYIREFTGKDLSNITRVAVTASNPLARTAAGKSQIASELLQYQLLKDPQQYLQLLQTGSLDILMEDTFKEQNNIQTENEWMLSGQTPEAIILDDHRKHIMHHMSVIADPSMRQDPELLANVLAHVNQHKDLLLTGDPMILQLTNQQPLMPPAPPQDNSVATKDGIGSLSVPGGAVNPGELPAGLPQPAGNPEAPVTAEQMKEQIK